MTRKAFKCRHCQRGRISRPRGLCWHCFYTPGVREQYPSTSKFGRWADQRRGGLAYYDVLDGPAWYIVGTRADGSRLILAEAASQSTAYRRRARLAASCEDYVAIDVEHAGQAKRECALR